MVTIAAWMLGTGMLGSASVARLRSALALALTAAALVLGACTQTRPLLPAAEFARPERTATVLLMPADIELYELTAAGLLEPNAAWTEAAKAHVADALAALLAERDAEIVPYRQPGDPVLLYEPEHLQLVKLHDAVGFAILVHGTTPELALPTKPDFDYTLGDGVAALRRDYGADYALFVALRDSTSSPGRVAMIVIAAALGVGLPGGRQYGFASLVDLESGDIVWFNSLASATGDLREAGPARHATEALLEDLPL